MNIQDAQKDFDERCILFQKAMAKLGMPIKCTDGYRSIPQQNMLYDLGRSIPGTKKVTNARGGESPHNYGWNGNGLARDWVFVLPHGAVTYKGNWSIFGREAKKVGLVWGGGWLRFKDRPHTEWSMWRQFKK